MVKVWINLRMSVISTTLFLAGATSSATGDFGHQFSLGLACNRGQLWMLSRPKAPRSGCWSMVPSKNQMRMAPTKLGRMAEKHEEPWEYQWTNKYKEMMFQSRYLLKTTSNNHRCRSIAEEAALELPDVLLEEFDALLSQKAANIWGSNCWKAWEMACDSLCWDGRISVFRRICSKFQ